MRLLALTGNPLSLVPDADGLDEALMRASAREFNQSETTFLLRASLPGATVRLRSFTPAGAEVGGAGHNALDAWLWLEAAPCQRRRIGAPPRQRVPFSQPGRHTDRDAPMAKIVTGPVISPGGAAESAAGWRFRRRNQRTERVSHG